MSAAVPLALPGQGIATIRGENLSNVTAVETEFPLFRRALAGVSVIVGYLAAPVVYVSPTQINFQVPTPPQGRVPGLSNNFMFNEFEPTVSVQVFRPRLGTGGVDSVPVGSNVVEARYRRSGHGWGLYTRSQSGCGDAVAEVDGEPRLPITPEQAAEPGQTVVLFTTGGRMLGGLPSATDGTILTGLGWEKLPGQPRVQVGSISVDSDVRLPGYGLGLLLVRFRIPEDVREGCQVPVRILDNYSSQDATIPIRRGGGACVRVERSLAVLTVSRNAEAVGEGFETTERMQLSGARGEVDPPADDVPPVGQCRCKGVIRPGVQCNDGRQQPLRFGSVTAERIGINPQRAERDFATGTDLAMPAGFLRGGTFRFDHRPPAIAEGERAPAFDFTFAAPPPIELIERPRPGSTLGVGAPIRIRWTNGLPGNRVVLKVRGTYGAPNECTCTADAAAGEMTMLTSTPQRPSGWWGAEDGEMEVQLLPPPVASNTGTFDAGLHATWRYVWRIGGFRFQNPPGVF